MLRHITAPYRALQRIRALYSTTATSPVYIAIGRVLRGITIPYLQLLSRVRTIYPKTHNAAPPVPGKERPHGLTINMLPDEVLLEIFSIYMNGADRTEAWHTLIHVCRNWRYIVFDSVHRLNLRLVCTSRTPVRKLLDLWPVLPIVILDHGDPASLIEGADNIIAALEQHDRVRRISLRGIPVSLFEILATSMQEQFPVLTHLDLLTYPEGAPVLPDSFLEGSAPLLQSLSLDSIAFPALRKLLLSAHHLVNLHLSDIPHSTYISPEAVVTCLSFMTSLEELRLGFRSPLSCPSRPSHPLPQTPIVHPALTRFWFRGMSAYLEDLVARIYAPLLNSFNVVLFFQLEFYTLQLFQFLSQVKKFSSPNRAQVIFDNRHVAVRLHPNEGTVHHNHCEFTLAVSSPRLMCQLYFLAQVCSLSSSPLSTLESLEIVEDQVSESLWQDDTEDTQWLELLDHFPTVKSLYLSNELAIRVAPALNELARATATDVLPALQDLFLEELGLSRPVPVVIGQFIAARQRSDHPVAVHHWERRHFKALIIGIDYTSSHDELKGPVNDAKDIKMVLEDVYRYHEMDITLLTDEQENRDTNLWPSTKNILGAIDNLVKGASRGDVFVLYYAGHCGKQIDEVGRKQQFIVTCEHEMLFGTTIHEHLIGPLPRGSRLTVILDASYSGSLLELNHTPCRNFQRQRAQSFSLRGKKRIELHRRNSEAVWPFSDSRNPPHDLFNSPDVILLSACTEDQQTWEDSKRKGKGMTTKLVKILRREPSIKLDDLEQRLKRHLSKLAFKRVRRATGAFRRLSEGVPPERKDKLERRYKARGIFDFTDQTTQVGSLRPLSPDEPFLLKRVDKDVSFPLGSGFRPSGSRFDIVALPHEKEHR